MGGWNNRLIAKNIVAGDEEAQKIVEQNASDSAKCKEFIENWDLGLEAQKVLLSCGLEIREVVMESFEPKNKGMLIRNAAEAKADHDIDSMDGMFVAFCSRENQEAVAVMAERKDKEKGKGK